MRQPLISVIICCYNRADMLDRTLASVYAQIRPADEILLYDDGSSDHTAEVAGRHGDRIRYVRSENQGIAKARTAACELAQGEFIAFLDDDDLMPADRLQNLYNCLQEHPQAVFAVGEIAYIDQQDRVITPAAPAPARSARIYADGFEAVMWPHVPATVHTTLFRRRHGEAVGWFDASFHQAGEDKDFFARLGRLGPVAYIPQVVSLYRRGHQSLSQNHLKISSAQLRMAAGVLDAPGSYRAEFLKRMQTRVAVALRSVVRNPALAGLPEAAGLMQCYQSYLPLWPRLRLRAGYALTRAGLLR